MNGNPAAVIREGKAVLGIELGSTRIKMVLIGEDHAPLASGSHRWENRLENGLWTYALEDAWTGMREAYQALKTEVQARYGVALTRLSCLGISAMMHGYLPFDKEGVQLAAFRTWRNTYTTPAARELTERFQFPVPESWTIAHLYQAMKDYGPEVEQIAHLTTLAGYVHWQLTGVKGVGVCEASGIFPLNAGGTDYDPEKLAIFDQLAQAYPWRLREILPPVLKGDAGCLTPEGALRLDPAGDLQPGCPLCPPEGDAATGMAATHSMAAGTGNVSAGTSIFALIVLEKPLSRVYPELEQVNTPDGLPVAVAHCNTCTSDINAWAELLREFGGRMGAEYAPEELYTTLFRAALEGEKDAGGIVNLPLFSGEPLLGVEHGVPMLVRHPEAQLTFANFARALLLGAITGLKLGMEILEAEQVPITRLTAHGGYFKTPGVGQRLLAAALKRPVSVMETAGEGGPWGMALLAAYHIRKEAGETLAAYLKNRVFQQVQQVTEAPDPLEAAGLDAYAEGYRQALGLMVCERNPFLQTAFVRPPMGSKN